MNRLRVKAATFFVLSFVLCVCLVGCGGSGSSGSSSGSSSSTLKQQGIFLDSPVEGLGYRSGNHVGITDSRGGFQFFQGETISFFIGDVPLGNAMAKSVMTPLDLVDEATDENHQGVVNIARFLQSLDADGNIVDSIQIPKKVRDTLRGESSIDFNQPIDDFTNDPVVKALFDKLNSAGVFVNGERWLLDAVDAKEHLQATFQEYPIITIKSPNGGEFEVASGPLEISWQACSSIENVTILFSNDGGETWDETPIAASTPNDGSYTWDSVPIQVNNTQNRIRVVDAGNPATYDDSNAHFTLLFPNDELTRIILESEGQDRDGDRLPDGLEEALGTDPDRRDSDRDGFDDYQELFGSQIFGDYYAGADLDNDGIIAALDPDDNGDGVNDGAGVDSDGDGIDNYLEINGFTYDWYSNSYALWDGVSFDGPYFKTDPRQISTDQDPFSDDMEASGSLMDVLVKNPGDLPMVPAYPNIVVRLEGYDVTLNSEISYSHGEALEVGRSWSREASVENAFEMGVNWEAGVTGKFGEESGAEVSAKIGGNFSATQTRSSTRSTGGSIVQDSHWERAVSSNPSSAAKVKLKLKVYNLGTAAASNILPTLTLKIGGASVQTFQPSNPISILEPGGIYPIQEGSYWVVDRLDSSDYIYLTLNELRALENGAPLSVEVSQLDGEVMLLNSNGRWESAGAWGEYMARCEAVCANIKLDIGNGNFIHHLVYASDAPYAPVVTLGDALRWIAGYEDGPDGASIKYLDRFGWLQETSLSGWNFIMDRNTVEQNNLLTSGSAPDLSTVILGPDTSIIVRAPRDEVGLPEPEIYYAYYDEEGGVIEVSAGDYNKIESVMFVDRWGGEHAMTEVQSGSGNYMFDITSLRQDLNGGTCSSDENGELCEPEVTPCEPCEPYQPLRDLVSEVEGTLVELARVTNIDDKFVERNLIERFQPDKPEQKMSITGVNINANTRGISAAIDYDPNFPPTHVYYIHPDFPLDDLKNPADLAKHPMYWYPGHVDQWIGGYPDWSATPDELAGMWIIAEQNNVACEEELIVDGNHESYCFASYVVKPGDVDDGACGSGAMNLDGYWSQAVFAQPERYSVADFDAGSGTFCQVAFQWVQGDAIWQSHYPYGAEFDLAALPWPEALNARHGVYKITDRTYEEIDLAYMKQTVVGGNSEDETFYSIPSVLTIGDVYGVTGGVWVIRTSGGRYVKVRLEKAFRHGYYGHITSHFTLTYAIYDESIP